MKKTTATMLRAHIYVVWLDAAVLKHAIFRQANPNHDPRKQCLYVGMTHLSPEERFFRHLHAILARAAGLHPHEGRVQFNLACYEAQMGSLDRAKAHLKRATEIDAKFKLIALDDPDLEPLWGQLSGHSWPVTN